MVEFRSHFDDLLAKRGLSFAAFAKLVDVSPSFLSDIRSGRNVIPPARVEQWADALGLKGAERRDFLLIAMLPKCPEAIRPYIVKLIGQR
jgi:transcriptional regulator with XRE-family HTH domain